MMKRVLILLSLISIFIISGCDLSHKHYYNDYGICNCGKDISLKLDYSNNEYISESHSVIEGESYYYKFKAHGENGIEFFLDNEDVTFYRIEIHTKGMLTNVATGDSFDSKTKKYTQSLTDGREYNLKITYRSDGETRLIIREV